MSQGPSPSPSGANSPAHSVGPAHSVSLPDLTGPRAGSVTAGSVHSPAHSMGGGSQAMSIPGSVAGSLPESCLELDHRRPNLEYISMSALIRARKKAEADEQLMANRVALLRREGMKAHKRIEQTHLKAMELQDLRSLDVGWAAIADEREAKLQAAREHHAIDRREAKQFQESVRHAMLQNKKGHAQALRETNQGLRDAKRQRDEEIHAAQMVRNYQLRAQVTGKERKEREQERRLAQLEYFRQEQKDKGDKEEIRTKRHEAKVKQLQREESHLLSWLQAKQAEQMDAYEDLMGLANATKKGKGKSIDH